MSKLQITSSWIFDCYSFRLSLHSQFEINIAVKVLNINVQFAAVLFNSLYTISILFRSIRHSHLNAAGVYIWNHLHPRAWIRNLSVFTCACSAGSSAGRSPQWTVCKHEKVSANTDCKFPELCGVPACAWHLCVCVCVWERDARHK